MALRRTLAALGCGVLLLAGCTDEATPRFEPTESPSPSESSEAPEPQTAEEFVRAWVQLDTEMQNTGETSAYLAASAGCASCEDFARRVEQVYEKGGSIQTGGWQIKSIEAASDEVYTLEVESRPTIVTRTPGADPERFPGGPVTYELKLEAVEKSWQVVDWYEVPA